MRREKYGHYEIQTQAKILHYSSLNVWRFGHQIYLQTVDCLGFSVGELRTITLWTGETIAVRSHHDSTSNFARLPWICAHPPTRSTLAYGPVRVTTQCHKNESARLHLHDCHKFLFRVKFFAWNTGHFFFVKKGHDHDLYAFRRTKMPKLSGEPYDLKDVLGEQKFFQTAWVLLHLEQKRPKTQLFCNSVFKLWTVWYIHLCISTSH